MMKGTKVGTRNYQSIKSRPTSLLLLIASLIITVLLAACGDATATTGPAAPVTNTTAPTTGLATTATTTAPATTASPTKPATPQSPAATPGATGPVSLGQPFYLKVGESATFSGPGMTIKFIQVSEDSRCPAANGDKVVACAWAGQVSAVLEVKQGSNQSETVTLTLPGATSLKTVPASATKNFGGYQLQLLTVEPHPIIDRQINPADYVATLQIIPAPATTTAPATTGATTSAPTTTAATTAVSTAPATTASPTRPADPETPAATPGAAGPVSLGQPFYLKLGESATVSGTSLSLKFALISEDSRCPNANPKTGKSVECFWAGQVTANIEVSEKGQATQTVKLTLPGSVNTNTTSKVTVGNYQIEVKQILPDKIIDVDIAPEDYVVTLVVSQ